MNACDKLSAAGITPDRVRLEGRIQLEWFIYQLADQLMSKADQVKWQAFDLPYTAAFQAVGRGLEQMISHECFAKGAEGHTSTTSPMTPSTPARARCTSATGS